MVFWIKKDLELERAIKCQVDYATHFWPEGQARKQEASGIVGGWNLYNINRAQICHCAGTSVNFLPVV